MCFFNHIGQIKPRQNDQKYFKLESQDSRLITDVFTQLQVRVHLSSQITQK